MRRDERDSGCLSASAARSSLHKPLRWIAAKGRVSGMAAPASMSCQSPRAAREGSIRGEISSQSKVEPIHGGVTVPSRQHDDRCGGFGLCGNQNLSPHYRQRREGLHLATTRRGCFGRSDDHHAGGEESLASYVWENKEFERQGCRVNRNWHSAGTPRAVAQAARYTRFLNPPGLAPNERDKETKICDGMEYVREPAIKAEASL